MTASVILIGYSDVGTAPANLSSDSSGRIRCCEGHEACLASRVVGWRGPWNTSSYRVFVDTKNDRTISKEIADALFDVPVPSLELTGDGIWTDRKGDTHFVRHAAATRSRTSAAGMSVAVIPKLLIVEYERARTPADLYDWLRCNGATGIYRVLSSSSSDANELLLPGASLLIGYEPRSSRVRIAWPDRRTLDLQGEDIMRGIWRFYFECREQPALAAQLVRWP